MRKDAKKIKIFCNRFNGLTHVYGTYDPTSGRVYQVKAPVTEKVVLDHLTGQRPYGIYLLVRDRIGAIAVDLDTQDRLPSMEFVGRAKHYGLSAYIERSKSKGYHCWIFFDKERVLAAKARLMVQQILGEIEEPDTEIFPKHDALNPSVRYGNFINAPLFGRLVPEGKTVFVDPESFDPYPDQWSLLESVHTVSEPALDEIVDLNELSKAPVQDDDKQKMMYAMRQGGFKLPQCAQRMLQQGVVWYQRVSCFRLAVHMKRVGLPYDVTVGALKTWAKKNQPPNGKKVIRKSEILSQTRDAYKKPYSACGCDHPAIRPFCDPSCPIRQRMTTQANNTSKKLTKRRVLMKGTSFVKRP